MPATDYLTTIRDLGHLLDDIEKARIANGNRLGAQERTYGSTIPELETAHGQLCAYEHGVELALVRAWRKHPLASWAKTQHGVGEKSIARLLSVIGDPLMRTLGHFEGEGAERTYVIDGTEKRTVSALWAYCGVGDPARIAIPKNATAAEMLARGKEQARKQVWLISTAMLKSGSRAVYDARRAHTAVTHPEWKDGHSHNDALRVQGKRFLLELYAAAERLAESETHTGRTEAAA